MQPILNVKFGTKNSQEQIPQEQQIQQGPQGYYAAQKNAGQKTRRTRNTAQANAQPSINIQRNVQQRKTPDMNINNNKKVVKDNVVNEFKGLFPNININYDILSQAINNAVSIDMNDNEYMTNENIIFNSKIKQIKYFLLNENYKNNFIIALNNGDISTLVNYIMMNDPNVYEDDWKNESRRLTSSIIEECTPNSDVQCEKCGQKTVYAFQRQVRSGDEGATTFFRCCNCGKTWQEN